MTHSIARRLAEGKIVRIFNVGQLASPKLIELVGQFGGYHGVWIDQEHAALDHREIELLALACRAVGLDSYVRLAPTDYATVMRPMEAGVGGVMAAQIRTLADARQVVDWARFPPLGRRGLNTSNYEGDWTTANLAEFVERSNRERWLAVQIETAEAVDEVDAIAGLPGIDHLFVGPADLSLALGVPGQFLHAKCVAALERVAAAVKKHGKTWGILPRGQEHTELCRKLGCLLFAFGQDLSFMHLGMRAVREAFPSYFAEP